MPVQDIENQVSFDSFTLALDPDDDDDESDGNNDNSTDVTMSDNIKLCTTDKSELIIKRNQNSPEQFFQRGMTQAPLDDDPTWR